MIREINLKIDWLLYFIVLLPTFYVAGSDLRLAQMNFFQISAILLVALMHINKWIGAFLAWALFQFTFFTNMPVQSETLYNLFLGAVLYQFIVMFSNKTEFKKYFWAFTGLLAVNVFWCFAQIAQLDLIFNMADSENQIKFTEYPGFFGLPAFLGNFASAVLPLSMFLSLWMAPIALLALFFSKSTFSVLAGLVSGLFFLWFRKRIVFWIVLLAGTASFLTYAIKYDMPTGEFGRRLEVWKIVLGQAFKKQFFGFGIGNYQNFYLVEATPSHKHVVTNDKTYFTKFLQDRAAEEGKTEVVDVLQNINPNYDIFALKKFLRKHGMDFQRWESVHNEFIELFFETGLVGIFIVFGFIFDLFKRFWRYGRKELHTVALMSAFIAILIVSFGHFPFHLARLAGPFIAMIAFLEVALLQSKRTLENTW